MKVTDFLKFRDKCRFIIISESRRGAGVPMNFYIDDDDPESILNTILANPEALKISQYGFLSVIHGELVRCVNINGEEFYYNYFIPESVVNKVRELCQK